MNATTIRPTRSQLARIHKIMNELRANPLYASAHASLALAGPFQSVTIRRDGTYVVHRTMGDIEMGQKCSVRICRNQWGNYLGYFGNVRVFETGVEFDAKTWLARQIKAGHPVSETSDIGAAIAAEHLEYME